MTGPILNLHFMRNNSVAIDTTHSLKHFTHLTMQIKAGSSETNAKLQIVITDDALALPPKTTKIITAFVDHPSDWNTTSIVVPLEKFTETASLLISHSMLTINDKKVTVRVTNVTESPYSIKKNTQFAELSVVTLEQSKHNKPVDMTVPSMIPQSHLDLTAYLHKLLRARKLEQQNKTFWSPAFWLALCLTRQNSWQGCRTSPN